MGPTAGRYASARDGGGIVDNLLARTGAPRLNESLFLVGYALFLAFGYMSFESPTVLASLGEQAALAQSLFLSLALGGRVLAYAVTAVALARRPNLRMPPVYQGTIAALVALAGFLLTHLSFDLAAYASLGRAMPWLALGSLLFGGGSALATLMWARASSSFEMRRIYLLVLLANLASLAVYLAATMLPAAAVYPASALLFLASVACCVSCLRRGGQGGAGRDAGARDALAALWRPCLGTSVLFFMSGLMLQLPHVRDLTLAQFQSTSLVTQGIVIAALLLPVLLVKRPLRLESVFKIALPLSATGFLLLPLVWSGGSGIANACAQLGSGVADIILWCMVASYSRGSRLPAASLFSCALLATSAAKLAGTLAGAFFQDELEQGGIALTAIALAAVYLVAMMSMFLFRDRRPGAEDGGAPPDDSRPAAIPGPSDAAEPGLPARCSSLARAFDLTPREAELLVELAQGRTLRAISEKLTVSENTVKYHVRGIYQKLGVHTRDEVIELVSNAR